MEAYQLAMDDWVAVKAGLSPLEIEIFMGQARSGVLDFLCTWPASERVLLSATALLGLPV